MTTKTGKRWLRWIRLVVAILGAGLLTLWPTTSASAATRSSPTAVVNGMGPTVAFLGPTADLSVCSRAGDGDTATPRTLVLNYQNWAAPAGAFLPTSTYDVQDDGYDCLSALSPREPGSASVRAPPQQAIHVSLGPLAPSACIRVAANGAEDLGGIIYRTGSRTDGALTDASGVSFRDSVSSSLSSEHPQVFRPGDKIWGVDTSQLPPGSVVRDGVPPGHVTVNATPEQIRRAIVNDSFLRDLGLKALDEFGSYRLPK